MGDETAKVRQTMADRLLPLIQTDLAEAGRATADVNSVAVWLVGLSSTLLALAVASPERVRAVVGSDFTTVTFLLLSTVIAGVASRILNVWAASALVRWKLHSFGYAAARVLELDSLEEMEEAGRILRDVAPYFGYSERSIDRILREGRRDKGRLLNAIRITLGVLVLVSFTGAALSYAGAIFVLARGLLTLFPS